MEISEISKSGIFCFGWLVVTITIAGLAHFHGVESVQPWHHINPQALRRFEFLRRKNQENVTVDFLFSKKHPAFHFWRFSFVLLLLTKKTHFSVSEAYTEFVRQFFFQLHQGSPRQTSAFLIMRAAARRFPTGFPRRCFRPGGRGVQQKKSCTSYQLRLLVYSIIYMVLYIPGG